MEWEFRPVRTHETRVLPPKNGCPRDHFLPVKQTCHKKTQAKAGYRKEVKYNVNTGFINLPQLDSPFLPEAKFFVFVQSISPLVT